MSSELCLRYWVNDCQMSADSFAPLCAYLAGESKIDWSPLLSSWASVTKVCELAGRPIPDPRKSFAWGEVVVTGDGRLALAGHEQLPPVTVNYFIFGCFGGSEPYEYEDRCQLATQEQKDEFWNSVVPNKYVLRRGQVGVFLDVAKRRLLHLWITENPDNSVGALILGPTPLRDTTEKFQVSKLIFVGGLTQEHRAQYAAILTARDAAMAPFSPGLHYDTPAKSTKDLSTKEPKWLLPAAPAECKLSDPPEFSVVVSRKNRFYYIVIKDSENRPGEVYLCPMFDEGRSSEFAFKWYTLKDLPELQGAYLHWQQPHEITQALKRTAPALVPRFRKFFTERQISLSVQGVLLRVEEALSTYVDQVPDTISVKYAVSANMVDRVHTISWQVARHLELRYSVPFQVIMSQDVVHVHKVYFSEQ